MSCQLQAGNQAGPQSSILPAGPGMLGGALSQSGVRLGSKLGCVSPSPVPTLRGIYTVPTVCLSRAGAGDSLRWEAAATGRMRAAPRAKGERLPVHLESTASRPREGRLRGEGPAGCRGPRIQRVDARAPHLSRRTSADPGRGWQRSFQKVAERTDNRFFAGTLPKFRESAPRRPVPPRQGGGLPVPQAGSVPPWTQALLEAPCKHPPGQPGPRPLLRSPAVGAAGLWLIAPWGVRLVQESAGLPNK